MGAGSPSRVLPLYLVVFIGFVGYRLMMLAVYPAGPVRRPGGSRSGSGSPCDLPALVIVPNPEGALWVTLHACSLALAVCLPSTAAMISAAVGPAGQGSALGSNQSLQVGAEGVSGLAGGGLAAISTALPLPAVGAPTPSALPFMPSTRQTPSGAGRSRLS